MCTSSASTSATEDALLAAAGQDLVQQRRGGLGQGAQRVQSTDVLAAVNVLDRHQADKSLVVKVMIEGQLGEPAHGDGRIDVVDLQPLLGLADAAVGVLQNRHVQLFLAAEVVVDHPLRGAGALGDLVDPRAREPGLGEYLGGDGEQLGAGSLGVTLKLGTGLAGHLGELTGERHDFIFTLPT